MDPHRIITTADEVNALPVDSVVRDADGDIAVVVPGPWDGSDNEWGFPGREQNSSDMPFLPVEVLYTPEESPDA